jgi:hypothetical protein
MAGGGFLVYEEGLPPSRSSEDAMSNRHRPAPTLLLLAAATTATATAADDLGLQFHGFVSQGYMLTEHDNYLGTTEGPGTLNFNEFALNATASPIDRLRIGLQIFARSVGDYGDDELELDWAYADYRLTNNLGVTVGRFKIPHGLYNETRDLDMTRTEVFLPMSVYSTRLRDVYLAVNGAEVYGTVPAKALGSFDGVFYVGGQNFENNGAVAKDVENAGAFSSIDSIELQRMVGGALTWNTPLEGLRLRASGFDAHNLRISGSGGLPSLDANGNPISYPAGAYGTDQLTSTFKDFYSAVLSIEYQYHDLLLAAEYTREYGKITTTSVLNTYVPQPVLGPPPAPPVVIYAGQTTTTSVAYYRPEGAYLSAAYQLMPKLGVAAGWGLAFADYDNRGLSCNRQWTLAARYDIFSNWLIKAECDLVRGTEELFASENPGTPLNRIWQIYAIKTTVDF